MSEQLNATITVRKARNIRALLEQLFGQQSGVYLVTVHNHEIVKIARVERPIVLQPKTR